MRVSVRKQISMAGRGSVGHTTRAKRSVLTEQNTLTRVCPCKQLLILAAVTVAKPVVERPPKTVLFYIVFVSYRFQYSSGSRGCCCFAAASQQQHGCFYSIWSARDRDKDVGSIR